MQPDSRIHPRHGAKTTGQKWLTILLFAMLSLLYFGFYIIGIISPAVLMQPIIDAVPLSFLVGAGIIVASVVITFVYAFVANHLDSKKEA